MRLLLDLDIVVYRAGFASQKTLWRFNREGHSPMDFGVGFSKTMCIDSIQKECGLAVKADDPQWESSLKVDHVSHALQGAKMMIHKIFTQTGTEEYIGFLSSDRDETLFRHKYAKTQGYKANRKDFKKPVHYEAIRKYLTDNYNTYVCWGIEADDALAMSQTEDTCIVSIDKDLLQIPGRHYNFVKEEWSTIGDLEGYRNMYAQALQGDRADNIPGLHQIGIKTAQKLLKDCNSEKDMYNICIEQYRERSGRKDYIDFLHEVINLVYLLREPNQRWAIPQ